LLGRQTQTQDAGLQATDLMCGENCYIGCLPNFSLFTTVKKFANRLRFWLYFPVQCFETRCILAQIWNSLPEHMVSAPTMQSFRRHLQRFLLQQYICL